MNYLWGGMILVGVVYGALTGRLSEVTDQALLSAKEAVTLCITMAGVMAFWVGIMEIAQRAGFIRKAAAYMEPVLGFLFPGVPKGHPARNAMATNMIANLLGLGWAATPAGLEAMKELKTISPLPENQRRWEMQMSLQEDYEKAHVGAGTGGSHKTAGIRREKIFPENGAATDAMCDFLIINISSLQLIPVNIIAYRSQYGSVNPAYVVGPAMIATLVSTLAAVLFIIVRRLVGKRL